MTIFADNTSYFSPILSPFPHLLSISLPLHLSLSNPPSCSLSLSFYPSNSLISFYFLYPLLFPSPYLYYYSLFLLPPSHPSSFPLSLILSLSRIKKNLHRFEHGQIASSPDFHFTSRVRFLWRNQIPTVALDDTPGTRQELREKFSEDIIIIFQFLVIRSPSFSYSLFLLSLLYLPSFLFL